MITKSESINELAVALSKAQAEFLPAKMNAVNPFFKSHYADLGSVITASKEVCAKYGLAVSQPVSTDGLNVMVTTLLMHSSGQWISSDMILPLMDSKNIAQAAGAIITYARRYSLSSMLGIYADEDTDGNGASDKKQATPVQQYQDKIREVEQNKPVVEATNSAGDTKLMDMDTPKLAGMANNLMKTLRDINLAPDIREAKQHELDTIQEIIADRNHPAANPS